MIPGVQCGKRCGHESAMPPGGAGWLAHPGGSELTLRAMKLAGMNQGVRILDLGCGSGESVKLLRTNGIDAIGVDQSLQSVQHSTRESNFWVKARAEELPFADSSMDGVLAECSLSLMREPQKVLAECARVLRPGGRLMISDLYARNPGAIGALQRLNESCVPAVFVRQELECWLHEAGFAPQCFEDHSRALREAVARFIFDHGSMELLWDSAARDSNAPAIAAAMQQVKAGYFLQISTHVAGAVNGNGENNGR